AQSVSKTREIFFRVDDIWDVVSDLGNEGRYWSGYGDVKVVSRQERAIEIEVSFAGLENAKGKELHMLYPKKSIATKLTGGPIVGERSLVLVPMSRNSTRVDVRWRFEPRGIPKFASDLVGEEIAKKTEEALNRIEESARRAAPFARWRPS
ncbi:MAG: SRPBCC family protein, partial [Thaumarchaeota archaeon]|nr:SRPBCC family protein [Nitrososphaerota archaeon]